MPRPPAKRAPARRPRTAAAASSRPRNVSGRGFYKGFGRDLGSYLGRGAGMLASTLTKVPGLDSVGARLGGYLGERGAKMTGWGAYTIKRNSLVASIPQIRNPGAEGAVQIRHKEYIGDILSSTTFETQYLINLNAALQQSFPWLANIAKNFQQFTINGMIFEYRPTSGSAISSTNNALGEVLMATNYNSAEEQFTNKLQMLNTEFSDSVVPCNPAMHLIECAPGQTTINLLYSRQGPVPPGTDARLYDLGFLQVATSGQQQAGVSIGELWVTYDVLLYKPILTGMGSGSAPSAGDDLAVARWQLTDVNDVSPFGEPLGTTKTLPNSSSLTQYVAVDQQNMYFTNHTAQDIIYLVSYSAGPATGASFDGPTTPVLVGCSSANLLQGNTSFYVVQDNGSTRAQWQCCIKVPADPGQTAPVSQALFPGFANGNVNCLADLWITQLTN